MKHAVGFRPGGAGFGMRPALIFVLFLVACGGGSSGGGGGDKVPPDVAVVIPLDVAVAIPVNATIVAYFSEAMEADTINTDTFILESNAPVNGTVSYDPEMRVAIFRSTSNLEDNTLHTARITTGVTDPAGNPLVTDVVWTFITGTEEDTLAPAVTSTSPPDGFTDVAVTTPVKAVFSEQIDPSTLDATTFTVSADLPVAGTLTYDPATRIATFTPDADLEQDRVFTATVTTGITDLVGNPLPGNKTWEFGTGTAQVDTTPPAVASTDPLGGAVEITLNRTVTVTFSEEMNPSTVVAASFFLVDESQIPVAGAVTFDGETATFTPDEVLPLNSVLTATVTTEAKDLVGNPLAQNYVWSFTTGNTVNVEIVGPFNACEEAYDPPSISVKMGTEVVWTNVRENPHTVTSSKAPSSQLSQCKENGDPADVLELNSGSINPGGDYEHTFGTAGTFVYDCVEDSHRMRGVVIVEP